MSQFSDVDVYIENIKLSQNQPQNQKVVDFYKKQFLDMDDNDKILKRNMSSIVLLLPLNQQKLLVKLCYDLVKWHTQLMPMNEDFINNLKENNQIVLFVYGLITPFKRCPFFESINGYQMYAKTN